jgi:N-methylhydantoinase A
VTDANLVLGRLSHGTLLGGGMEVDVEASKRVITDKLAGPLGLSVEAAAEGMIRVVVATMTAAIRKLTVERGYDPRTFTLCPFGGAGPLHGAEIAREMNVDQVLVPLAPGVTSAVGLLMSQLREDSVRTQIELLSQSSPDQILSVMDELENAARMRLAFAAADYGLRTTIQLGMRYLGQGFDIAVEVPAGKPDLVAVAAAFHAAHERMYGFSREDQPVELVSIWVSVEVDLGVANLPEVNAAGKTAEPESRRKVVYDGQYIDTPVFRRDDLGAGNTIEGPAIVEQLDSTTVLWPGQTGTVDQHGQLLLGAVS